MEAIERQLIDKILHDFPKFAGKGSTEIKEILSGITSDFTIKVNRKEDDVEDLKEKIDMYLSGKALEGLAKTTLCDYECELRLFQRFISVKTHHITTSDIRAYLGSIEGVKQSTLKKKYHVLRSFFSWMHSEEVIEKNPTTKIKPPKVESMIPSYYSIRELETIRENCHTPRIRAMLELTYATGCRISEIRSIKIDDIDFANMSIVVIGKGNKQREVFFNDKSLLHINKYLASRDDECPYLFVTERKPMRKMGASTARDDLNKVLDKSEINGKTFHSFRRSFGTHLYEKGIDILTIKELLGHADLSSTEHYLFLSKDKKESDYRKAMRF
jgi:integrase/recombinase XerD